MKLKHNHFCGLSSATDWRTWLKSVAQDLYNDLVNAPKKGCKANQEKMVEIHQILIKRGLQAKLEAFIRQRFPYVIDEDDHSTLNVLKPMKPAAPTKPVAGHIESMNKHKVFRSYRPDILTFPHRYIIIGDQSTLKESVSKFTFDKVGVDVLVIEDHAYIEYFHKRYSD